MATIKSALRRWEGLNTDQIILKAFDDTLQDLAGLNKDQLAAGLRSDGSEIRPKYAPLTIELKKHNSGIAAITSHVTLFETGSLYNEFYVERHGDVLKYGSRDEKFEKNNRKYSTSKGSIGGVTKESRQQYIRESLFPIIKQQITQQTGFKFIKK